MSMKLIVGLGNPGRKFAKTRHNVGHMFVSVFSKQLSANSKKKAVNRKPYAVCRKTTVFMNDSGKEVKKLTAACRLPPADLLVVHDDMDLPLGEWKLSFGKGPAGHKGVQSIIDALGTKDFWRLRIGIGRPPEGVSGESWVLQPFPKEELEEIKEVLPKLLETIMHWVEKSH